MLGARRQFGTLRHHFDGGGGRPAIGMAERHEQGHAEKLHRVFKARQTVVIEEIAGEPHHEEVARSLVEGELRGYAVSEQLRISATGNGADTRAARPAEKSFCSGAFAA